MSSSEAEASSSSSAPVAPSDPKQEAIVQYRKILKQHEDLDQTLKNIRLELRTLESSYSKSEDDIKALQSVGQIIGEVLKQLDEERFIVKASSGPRYVVGCRSAVPKHKLKTGTRVSLDMTTLTIMRILPREVDPLVYNMSMEDPGGASFAGIGGLGDQIRELREVIELPLMNPELFLRVGIKPPKGSFPPFHSHSRPSRACISSPPPRSSPTGVLLYGPPGTGKTLLARAVAATLSTNFLKVVSSAIVDKYIGESARLIREMFGYAREHEPCIIFMDEIDAIGGRRFSEGTSADREIQRTLMELLNQLDGFDYLGKTKVIFATNRVRQSSFFAPTPSGNKTTYALPPLPPQPDTLDPALLRPGRVDRKIEIPLPNEVARMDILKIHAGPIRKNGEIDYEAIVKLSEGFNGADLRNVCTEAGMFAIRDDRDYVLQDDFMKGARKLQEAKKHESESSYEAV
ncbi:hypothetical protein P7C70_g2492, partial [Phenoliferia sp. Uapishka_3]